MAVSETPRHKLKQYSSGSDAHPNRNDFNTEVAKLEELPAIKQGSTGARPLSGVGKILYWDEAVKRFLYDDGSDWQDVAPIGGATPSTVAVGGSASEGVSPRAARADHTHPLPTATSTTPGAMPAADKLLIDTASSISNSSTLVKRDTQGRFQAALPNATYDVANKTYVDNGLAGKSGTGHSHVNATTSAPGFMSAADKAKLDVIATIGTWVSSGVVTPAEGWEITLQSALRFGPLASVFLWFKRTGTNISGTADGNIANLTICTMDAEFSPSTEQREGSMSTGTTGRQVSVSVRPNGITELTTMVGAGDLKTGDSISIQGTWMAE